MNYARRPVRLTIEIAIDSDFADIFDVKADGSSAAARSTPAGSASRRELRTVYDNGDFRRELIVTVDQADAPPQYANGRLVFVAEIPPKGTWHTCLRGCRSRTPTSRGPRTSPCNAVEVRCRWPASTAAAGGHAPDAERHRPAGLAAGRPRHGGAPPRGPDVRARRLHPGGRRAVVRDAVRPRHARRLDADDLAATRSSPTGALRRLGGAAGDRRRPGAGHGAGQDPARDPPRRARPARDPAVPAVLRHPRRDEPLPQSSSRTSTTGSATWVLAALPRERRGRAALDRPLRRPRPGRVPGVRDALAARLLQPGLEGRRRRDPARRRHARPAADRDVRAPGLRLRREAPDGRHLRAPRPGRGRRAGCGARRPPCTSASTTRSGGRRRGPTTSASTAPSSRPDGRLERRPPAPVGDRPARARRPGRGAAAAPTTCGRAGAIRTLSSDHVALQPVQLPHGLGLAARQRDDRRRLPALRVRRRGREGREGACSTPPSDSSQYRLPELFAGLPRREASFPVQYLGANVPQAWAAARSCG